MNSGPIAVVVAGLVLVGGITYAFVNHKERMVVQYAGAEEVVPGEEISQAVENPERAVEVIHVDELAVAPQKFPNEVTLRAVVSGVNESEGVFSVIDSREFERCGVVSCARYYLPVRIEGELPKPRTLLQITGQVTQSEKGLVFEASRMEEAR